MADPIIRLIAVAEAQAMLGLRREGVNVEAGAVLCGVEVDGQLATIGSVKRRGDTAVLSMDFTEPEWRGRGFHRQLIAHRLEMAVAAGCRRAEASCLKPSIKNYLRAGFVIVAQRKHGWLVRKTLV